MSEPKQVHEYWEELAAGHALHALSPADEEQFLGHAAGCTECTRALDEYRLVGAQLGALADAESDDPPTWQQIRGGVLDVHAPTVTDLGARRRPAAVRMLGVAAAVVTATALGTVTWSVTHRGDAKPQLATTALQACRHQVGCQVIKLHSPSGASPAAVTVSADRVAVIPLTLPTASAGRTYVLWQMPRDGGPIPVSEFRSTDRQTASTPLPVAYGNTTAFAISLESGRVTPTRPTHVLAIGTTS